MKKKYLRILRKERFQIVASIRHGRRRAVKTRQNGRFGPFYIYYELITTLPLRAQE